MRRLLTKSDKKSDILKNKVDNFENYDYWLDIYFTYLFLKYDQFQSPKDNTLFPNDVGRWLWFLYFDLEMWDFSFSDVQMWEFDGGLKTDQYYDTRQVYGKESKWYIGN